MIGRVVALRVGTHVLFDGDVVEIAEFDGTGVTVRNTRTGALTGLALSRLVAGCAATTTGTDDVADAGGAGVLLAGLTTVQRAEVAARAGHVHDLLEADGSLLRDRLAAKAAELRVTVRRLQRWLAGYRSDGEAGLVDARWLRDRGSGVDPR